MSDTIQERLRGWSGTPILDLKMPVLREAADEIDRLSAEVESLQGQIEARNAHEMEKGIYITSEQIDAAWKKSSGEEGATTIWIDASDLGIVECGECGGSGVMPRGGDQGTTRYECPDCHGHGWVRKNA